MAGELQQFLAEVKARADAKGITLTDEEVYALVQRKFSAQQQPQQPSVPVMQAQPEGTPPLAANRPAPQGLQDIPNRGYQPPGSIERNIQPAMAVAGGMGGAALGMAGGAPGMAAGGMFGGATGGVLGEGAEHALAARRQGVSRWDLAKNLLTPPSSVPELHEDIQSAQGYAKTGLADATLEGFGFGAAVAAPRVARTLLYRTTGVNQDPALQIAKDASDLGIDLGIVNATRHKIIAGYPRIMGSFPFINTPIKRNVVGQAQSVVDSSERLAVQIGPVVGLANSGKALARTGGAAFRVFKSKANGYYDEALSAAKDAGATINNNGIIAEGENIIAGLTDAMPKVKAGKKVARFRSSTTGRVKKFAQKVASLTDKQTVEEFRGLAAELDNEINLAKQLKQDHNVKTLLQIKSAMEEAFGSMNAPDEVLQLVNKADAFYKEGMGVFQSSTAKKFGRIDRNIFKVGFKESGEITEDQLHKVVFREESPQAIRELRNIMMQNPKRGRAAWRSAVGSHFDEIFTTANKSAGSDAEMTVLDYGKIRSRLGLDNKKGARYAATVEMLKTTGVNARDIEKFLNIAQSIFKEGIPNVNDFIRRRAVLGGSRSMLRSFNPFGQTVPKGQETAFHTAKNLAGSLSVLFGARQLGDLLTSPRGLRAAIDAAKPGLSQAQRTAALKRMSVAIPGIFAMNEAGERGVEQAQALYDKRNQVRQNVINPLGALLQGQRGNQ